MAAHAWRTLGPHLQEWLLYTQCAAPPTLAVLAYATAHLSGGQINPAVTLGELTQREGP